MVGMAKGDTMSSEAPRITTIQVDRETGEYAVITNSDRTTVKETSDLAEAWAFAEGFDAGAAFSRARKS
jgi:hypothetical protein